MKLAKLLNGVEVIQTNVDMFETNISGVSSDNAKVKSGDLFVCMKGMTVDSHFFIGDVISKGAAAVVVQFTPESIDVPYILVRSSRAALACIWNNYCKRPSDLLRIVAVTGTNGKTSTTHMLRSIFNEAGYKTALIGTVTNTLTTPDPEQLFTEMAGLVDLRTDYLFMEASSHALALSKLESIKFKAGIFTNLTPEHLDFHGNMDNYYKAKRLLFRQCEIGIFNYDDEYALRAFMDSGIECEKLSYSLQSNEADYIAKNIKDGNISGISYNFLTLNRMFRINCSLQGRFTVYNTLAAAACAYRLGIEPSVIQAALRKLKGVPGRLERVPILSSDFSVFIDYAHTPDALENVLKTIRSFITDDNRLTVLFGCGGDRDRSKRPLMGAIASRLADFVIVTSDNSRTENPEQIIRQILKGIDKERPYKVIPNRKEAIEYAVRTAKRGDVILLAGKGHENYEITADGKHPFNETDIVLHSEELR